MALHHARNIGFSLAIDDFWCRIRQHDQPAERARRLMKIDRSFIAQIHDNERVQRLRAKSDRGGIDNAAQPDR